MPYDRQQTARGSLTNCRRLSHIHLRTVDSWRSPPRKACSGRLPRESKRTPNRTFSRCGLRQSSCPKCTVSNHPANPALEPRSTNNFVLLSRSQGMRSEVKGCTDWRSVPTSEMARVEEGGKRDYLWFQELMSSLLGCDAAFL